jgi:DNA-binding SARP family transcriptional activator
MRPSSLALWRHLRRRRGGILSGDRVTTAVPPSGSGPVVEAYFIEPDLDVWVDIEAFEEQVKSARQHLTSGERGPAQADFAAAISLYQGDFLADDPYEQWAIIDREHLRLSYLDVLDQLSRLRFSIRDYCGCAETCRMLLASDNCR